MAARLQQHDHGQPGRLGQRPQAPVLVRPEVLADGARVKTVRRTARTAIPAGKVAEAVHAALTAPRPKARYVVGTDARVQLALHALPERAFDAAVARLTGGR